MTQCQGHCGHGVATELHAKPVSLVGPFAGTGTEPVKDPLKACSWNPFSAFDQAWPPV